MGNPPCATIPVDQSPRHEQRQIPIEADIDQRAAHHPRLLAKQRLGGSGELVAGRVLLGRINLLNLGDVQHIPQRRLLVDQIMFLGDGGEIEWRGLPWLRSAALAATSSLA